MEGNEDNKYAEGRRSEEILVRYADELLIWQPVGHVTKHGWGLKQASTGTLDEVITVTWLSG